MGAVPNEDPPFCKLCLIYFMRIQESGRCPSASARPTTNDMQRSLGLLTTMVSLTMAFWLNGGQSWKKQEKDMLNPTNHHHRLEDLARTKEKINRR